MSRSVSLRTLRWMPLVAGLLILGSALPAQAQSDWIKPIARTSQAQGIAAAPEGGFYVVDGPTEAAPNSAPATISRYTAAGDSVWSKTLAPNQKVIRSLASDANGNAYVTLWSSTSTPNGFPYTLQQIKPNGTLGWHKTWYDLSHYLYGHAIATRGTTVYVGEYAASAGTMGVRRFATADGKAKPAWSYLTAQAPADIPIQMIATAQGLFVLEEQGHVVRLTSDGKVTWKKTIPGWPDRGSMGVDSTGVSIAYDDTGNGVLRIRRLSLAGAKLWDKPVPGAASRTSTATVVNGQTFTVGTPAGGDAVKAQLLITRFDKNGVAKGDVTIGTPNPDDAGFLLPRGGQLFLAGFDGTNPLIGRVTQP